MNCTWDEPEEDNMRNAILFKDDLDGKIDLDDYIAPEIDEGYDPDEEEEDEANNDLGVDSGASSSDEEEPSESKPSKKLVKSGVKSTETTTLKDLFKPKKQDAFSDFDKSKKKGKGLKISFQNPLEDKNQDQDDNTLGKRVYRMKHTMQPARDYDEFRVENSRLEDNVEDFFDGVENDEDEYDNGEAEHLNGTNKGDKVKLNFKDRMKDKKKTAKLEKERKRNELRALKEERFGNVQKAAHDLELVAGEQKEKAEFRPNYKDSRFTSAFDDPEMAIDTTSTMYKQDKHAAMLIEKKKHRSQMASSN